MSEPILQSARVQPADADKNGGILSEAQKTFAGLFTKYMKDGVKDALFSFIDQQGFAELDRCTSLYFLIDILAVQRDRSRTVFARLAERIVTLNLRAALIVNLMIGRPGMLWFVHYQDLEAAQKTRIDKAINKQKKNVPRVQRTFVDALMVFTKDPKATPAAISKLIVPMKAADLQTCLGIYLDLSQVCDDKTIERSLDIFFLVSYYALKTGRSTFAIEYEKLAKDPSSVLHARLQALLKDKRDNRGPELVQLVADAKAADALKPGARPGEVKLPPLNRQQAAYLKAYRAYVDGGKRDQMTAFENALKNQSGEMLESFVAVYLDDSTRHYGEPASARSLEIFFGTLWTALDKSSSFYAFKVKSYLDDKDGLWSRRFDELNVLQYANRLRSKIDEEVENKRLIDELKIGFWLKYRWDPNPIELWSWDPVTPGPDPGAINSALGDIDVAAGITSFQDGLAYLDKAYSAVAAAIETVKSPIDRWMLVRRILDHARQRPGHRSLRFWRLAYLQGIGLVYLACARTYKPEKKLYWSGFDQAERGFFFELREEMKDRYFADFAAQVDGTASRRGERTPRLRDPYHPNWDPGKNDDFYTGMAKAEGSLHLCADRMNFRLTPPLVAASLRGSVQEAWDNHRDELEAIRIPLDYYKDGKRVELKVGETIGNVYILWWEAAHSTAYVQVSGYGQVIFEADPDRLRKAYADMLIYTAIAKNTEGIALAIPFMFQILGYLPDLVSGGMMGLLKSVLFNLEFDMTMEAMGIDPTKAQMVLFGLTLLHAGLQPKAEEPHLGTTPEPAVPAKAGPTKGEFFGQDIGHMPAPEAPRLQFFDVQSRGPPIPVTALAEKAPVGSGIDRAAGSALSPDQRMTGPAHSGTQNSATPPSSVSESRRTSGGVYSQGKTAPIPGERIDPFAYDRMLTNDWEPRPRSVAYISSGDEGFSGGTVGGKAEITNSSRATRPKDFTPDEVQGLVDDLYAGSRAIEPEGKGSHVDPEASKAFSVGESNEFYFNARSGSSAKNRPDDQLLESLSPGAVSTRDHARQMVQSYHGLTGFDPPHAPGLDYGVPGSFYSSHVEIQQLRAHSDPAHSVRLGVNKTMCGSCRRAVQAHAQLTGREIVVVDPDFVRRFHSDGSVDIYPLDDPTQIIRAGPGEAPSVRANAPAAEYDGIPW